MIVLAESNFVLELALRQEQFQHAERILRLAEEQQLQLVVPACSLIEPYETLIRRWRERSKFSRRLKDEVQQLKRSALYDGISAPSEYVLRSFEAGIDTEKKYLQQTTERLTRICLVPVLSPEIVRLAQTMQPEYNLEPQDAIVFASIDTALQTLGASPKVFVNKNSKEFTTRQIEGRLEMHRCRLITSFPAACQYIENELRRKTPGR